MGITKTALTLSIPNSKHGTVFLCVIGSAFSDLKNFKDRLFGKSTFFGTSFEIHDIDETEELQRKWNVTSSTSPLYVREFTFFFFGIFCVSQIVNTILTTVYINLSSSSYGKYKEAKCHI